MVSLHFCLFDFALDRLIHVVAFFKNPFFFFCLFETVRRNSHAHTHSKLTVETVVTWANFISPKSNFRPVTHSQTQKNEQKKKTEKLRQRRTKRIREKETKMTNGMWWQKTREHANEMRFFFSCWKRCIFGKTQSGSLWSCACAPHISLGFFFVFDVSVQSLHDLCEHQKKNMTTFLHRLTSSSAEEETKLVRATERETNDDDDVNLKNEIAN